MAKKRIQKIPKHVVMICPYCGAKNKANVDIDSCPQHCICPKCNQEIRTPMAQCCIICAYSKKKCPRSLFMEARIKGLELR